MLPVSEVQVQDLISQKLGTHVLRRWSILEVHVAFMGCAALYDMMVA